jgi:hypothetical protein
LIWKPRNDLVFKKRKKHVISDVVVNRTFKTDSQRTFSKRKHSLTIQDTVKKKRKINIVFKDTRPSLLDDNLISSFYDITEPLTESLLLETAIDINQIKDLVKRIPAEIESAEESDTHLRRSSRIKRILKRKKTPASTATNVLPDEVKLDAHTILKFSCLQPRPGDFLLGRTSGSSIDPGGGSQESVVGDLGRSRDVMTKVKASISTHDVDSSSTILLAKRKHSLKSLSTKKLKLILQSKDS